MEPFTPPDRLGPHADRIERTLLVKPGLTVEEIRLETGLGENVVRAALDRLGFQGRVVCTLRKLKRRGSPPLEYRPAVTA
jgi:hypothetical protein